ncbi:MAG: hypothetical protein R3F07_07220 [Opitutaceae bacterium]
MNTQVEFRSGKFPPYEGEEDQINPGLWGKRLTEYLAAKLSDLGIEYGEMNAEDWGWYLPIRIGDARLALCCGHQDGDADEFVCFTEPSTPIVKKLFRRVDVTAELTRLTEALRHILSSDPDIKDVVWIDPV